MALSQIMPVEKAYKPSKLETFAKILDIATSIGSLAGNVSQFIPKTNSYQWLNQSTGAWDPSKYRLTTYANHMGGL